MPSRHFYNDMSHRPSLHGTAMRSDSFGLPWHTRTVSSTRTWHCVHKCIFLRCSERFVGKFKLTGGYNDIRHTAPCIVTVVYHCSAHVHFSWLWIVFSPGNARVLVNHSIEPSIIRLRCCCAWKCVNECKWIYLHLLKYPMSRSYSPFPGPKKRETGRSVDVTSGKLIWVLMWFYYNRI